MNQLPQNLATKSISLKDEQQADDNKSFLAVENSRAIQQVQASLVIAKRFPRDEVAAHRKIINACQRPGLAEVATYTYSRGGSEITGPSIRLAEAIAQYWGNIEFGWRELDRRQGSSLVQAYCWDKETNTQREMTFDVKHVRDTKSGGKVLKDERDIYENNANYAARRMRACILAMIPGDIIEDAVVQCQQTLETKVELTPERINNMVKLFGGYGVNKEMLAARIQRNLEAITPVQFINLGKIANSLKEGMSKPEEWFDLSLGEDKPDDKKAVPAASAPAAVQPETPPAAPAQDKSNLENFKDQVKADKAKKNEEEKKDVTLPTCKTCDGRGIVEDADGKGPCPDCQ